MVYTTNNRAKIAGTIVFVVGIPSGGGDAQLGIELAGQVRKWPFATVFAPQANVGCWGKNGSCLQRHGLRK